MTPRNLSRAQLINNFDPTGKAHVGIMLDDPCEKFRRDPTETHMNNLIIIVK